MSFELSCAFATSMATPDHVAVAESLGYRRAWLYDSPALYPDVWVMLARCADRTSTIGLGPGVLIPSLRHPMTNAAAIATLVDLAGAERVAVGVGTGFTGRFTLGQKPLRWAFVADYVRAVQALLRGEVVEWEGAKMQMIHPDGYGAARPIEVPFLLGAAGPKGIAAAPGAGGRRVHGRRRRRRRFRPRGVPDVRHGRSTTATTCPRSGSWPPPATAPPSTTTSGSRTAGRWPTCRGARTGWRPTPTFRPTCATSPSTTGTSSVSTTVTAPS